MKGEAKKQWGKLTDDDLDVINGEKDKLIGKLQERYGHTREQAETEYNNWSNTNVR
ncbi:CsbD family protein [Paenibacillus sp. An7]|uniref:CsbD family protein n=1 Tax=Paenibacillus sp. An7 TaxID=2689577 RepID=UPI00135C182F|nr:CsbD family protein [Paenibacillus sp. An7]